jgi:hypothetical protein
VKNVVPINSQAEQVSGHKADLRRAQANHADNDAVKAGHNPALPFSPANKNGGGNREQARKIIKTKHQSPLFI